MLDCIFESSPLGGENLKDSAYTEKFAVQLICIIALQNQEWIMIVIAHLLF